MSASCYSDGGRAADDKRDVETAAELFLADD
jgi:hypothetical protein